MNFLGFLALLVCVGLLVFEIWKFVKFIKKRKQDKVSSPVDEQKN